ncbi:polynucleotide kinase 3'-phosphatase [Allomyces macrogynus ATCC 38327]|uniref:Polynucleotide kinase 3'-phosphatase n=1 Tax=Allomyces macrogynus (strain ATCC 38327) TaxID=578462 RepID=A0A0L0T7U5_ALLM3|nr:polynucleotide kinase 3'-phosphatase [Allomyces macrogynus ATCC 38327]|eukprot:KNE70822.1 polynucleotide kinase 3'-phosphatase [Allomyces macrogynus ATCC 38327]
MPKRASSLDPQPETRPTKTRAVAKAASKSTAPTLSPSSSSSSSSSSSTSHKPSQFAPAKKIHPFFTMTRSKSASRHGGSDATLRIAVGAQAVFGDTSDDVTPGTGDTNEPIRVTPSGREFHDEDFGVRVHGTLCVVEYKQPQPSARIASFDLDKTLIHVKSGRKWPKDRHDWEFLGPRDVVRNKLVQLHEDGYKLVIFTNQAGIGSDKGKLVDFQLKIKDILHNLDVPFQVFIACTKDMYRKPLPGMWHYFVEHGNGGVAIDREASFFVGDAAGRPYGWKPKAKKDFADTDRKFALNAGIGFHTPDEFFFEEPIAPFELTGYDPQFFATLLAATTAVPASSRFPTVTVREEGQEILVLVGSPGSGKSTLSAWLRDEHGYTVVNQDTLRSREKCVKEARLAVQRGESVVIDNTNGSKETRALYLEIAQAHDVPARCLHLTTPVPLAQHLDMIRDLTGQRPRLPTVAFNAYVSRFVQPSADEGFHEVVPVPFVPFFAEDDDMARKLAAMWLT